MPQQEIICTVLPSGLTQDESGGTLWLSLFVSPRLRFDRPQDTGTLDAFPDFRNWPDRLASGGLAIDLIVDDQINDPKAATIVTKTPPESALWAALLGLETHVISHQPGLKQDHCISTYPAAVVAKTISDGYKNLGKKSPYHPADEKTLASAFDPVHRAIMPNGERKEWSADRLKNVDGIADVDLEAAHNYLSKTLLRRDAEISFTEKLAAVTAIASRRAASRTEKGTGALPMILQHTGDAASAFTQLAAFHRRARTSDHPARRRSAAPRSEPVKDFHEILASLGEYPDLLRRMGLVIDLKIDASTIPSSAPGAVKRLRAAPRLAGIPESQFKTPATKYLLSLSGESTLPFPVFCAAPKSSDRTPDPAHDSDGEILGGFLNLSLLRPDDPLGQTPQFGLTEIDLDGAGLKLLNALDTVLAHCNLPARPIDQYDQQSAGAPTLRTSGLSLVRANFARQLTDGIDRADELETGMHETGSPVLFAEDLVRGYRIDVRSFERDFQFGRRGSTTHAPWHSLHHRKGTFTVPRDGEDSLQYSIAEEGFIQPVVTQDTDAAPIENSAGSSSGSASQPLYISESIFHWQGWSLSLPPPDTPIDTEQFARRGDSAVSNRPMAHFEPVPGSLPRLRFGRYYQLRARSVDLAGNSLTVEQADNVLRAFEEGHRKQPIFPQGPQDFLYRRFDPILPPALVLHDELTEGEEPDVLVIRSDDGLLSEAYAATLGDLKYKGVTERHVVPPKTSQRMAETHGMYEAAFGVNGDPARFYGICAKESGTLDDTHIVNVTTGQTEPLPDLVDNHTGKTVPFGLQFIESPGGSGSYAIHRELKLLLPYLPDPLARGAALFGLPGVNGNSGLFNDQTGELTWSGSAGQVLPTEAHRALGFVTRIGFGNDWPDRMPFRLQLADTRADLPQPLPQWDASARLLRVQLPPGETATVWLSSYPGDNDIGIFGLYFWWDAHVGSSPERSEFLNTAKHGALTMLSPARKVTLVHAVQKPVRLSPLSPTSTLDVRRFPNDTSAYFGGTFRIHGPSTAKLDLWAAWKDPGEHGADPISANAHVLELPIHAKGVSEEEAAAAGEKPIATYAAEHADSFQFKAPPSAMSAGAYRARHDFGDTKYRKVTYTLTATSRYLEYFPKRITSDPRLITRSISLEEDILSSAPPAAPQVTSVVPILKRQEIFDLSDLIEVRRGGGLRVFLGSTWHSSGAGEKLALIGPVQWGLDPVHCFASAESAPALLPGVPAVNMDGLSVYPYDIEYDKERASYYVNLTFNAGDTYFPFIELKLARYQANSLEGMHLSPQADAGIHQLPPDRTVKFSYPAASAGDPGLRINFAVFGKRPSAAMHPPDSRGYRIDVALEERIRRSEEDDKDLGWNIAENGQPMSDAEPIASTLWSGHIFLPPPDAKERRIVIREFELFQANDNPPGQDWIGQTDATAGFSGRIVYADTIQLF